MNNAYIKLFYKLVKQTVDKKGLHIPSDVEAYVVFLLARYVKNKKFPPNQAFILSFQQIAETTKPLELRNLGDDCLFLTSAFPTYVKTQGLTLDYFFNIGSLSYCKYSRFVNDNFYIQLSELFVFLRDFVEQVLESIPNDEELLKWLSNQGSINAQSKLSSGLFIGYKNNLLT